jgi:acyl-ACP thioesterase
MNTRVCTSMTDTHGRLKFVSAIDMMQDCSQLWLESEPAVAHYFEENDIIQILVSRQVDVNRMPVYGERLTVRTSVYECRSFLGYRNTMIYDEADGLCLASWSTGAFVNKDGGKPRPLPREQTAALVMDPKADMEYLGKKIVPPGEGWPLWEGPASVPVRRNDIDFNRHMNNARYVQIACEYLPEDFDLLRLRVEYKIPAKEGDFLYPGVCEAPENFPQAGLPRRIFVRLADAEGRPYTLMEFTARSR